MTIATPIPGRYRVSYRRDLTSRLYHVTVTARDSDEARAKARIRDRQYLASARVRRIGDVREFVGRKHLDTDCPVCARGGMMPPHNASPRCESGGHEHCSCDVCF